MAVNLHVVQFASEMQPDAMQMARADSRKKKRIMQVSLCTLIVLCCSLALCMKTYNKIINSAVC